MDNEPDMRYQAFEAEDGNCYRLLLWVDGWQYTIEPLDAGIKISAQEPVQVAIQGGIVKLWRGNRDVPTT